MLRARGKQASQGMPVGARCLSACLWSGRTGSARVRSAALASATLAVLLHCDFGCGRGESDPEPDSGDAQAGAASTVFDAGGEVAVPPNGELLCPPGACNYQTQSGCSEDEACWPFVSPGGEIQPACANAGTRGAGQSCSEWADCARGYACIDSKCRHLCCGGDWSACADGDGCIRRLALQLDGGSFASGASLCYPVNTCDVLAADACASEPGQSCQVVDPRGSTACAPAGQAEVGEPCSTVVICAAGSMCVADACRRLCRAEAGGEPSCPAEEGYCVHFSRDPEGVGECTRQDE